MTSERECSPEVEEANNHDGKESDSEDDFSCLHEKFITKSQKKSELRAEGKARGLCLGLIFDPMY